MVCCRCIEIIFDDVFKFSYVICDIIFRIVESESRMDDEWYGVDVRRDGLRLRLRFGCVRFGCV